MTVGTVAPDTLHNYQVRLLDFMRARGIDGKVEYSYLSEKGTPGRRWSESDFRAAWRKPADWRTVFDNEVVLDFDLQQFVVWEALADAANLAHELLEHKGIPHWFTYSGGNGAHIHIFFDQDNLHRAIRPNIVRYAVGKALVTLIGDFRIDFAWLAQSSHLIREFGSGKENFFGKSIVEHLPPNRTLLFEQAIFPQQLDIWELPDWFLTAELRDELRKGCRQDPDYPAEYKYVIYKHPEDQEFPMWLGEAACPPPWSDSGTPPEGVSTDWVSHLLYTGDALYMREAANQLELLLDTLVDKCIHGPQLRPEVVQAECEGIQLASDEIKEQVIWGIRRFAEGSVRRRAAAGKPSGPPPTPEGAQAVIRSEIHTAILPFLKALLHYVQDSEKVVHHDWLSTYDPRVKSVQQGRIRTWAAVHGALDYYIHYLETTFETTFRPARPWFPPR